MDAVGVIGMLLVRRRNNISESSSSSDEDWEAALRERGRRKLRPRIIGYDEVVRSYMDHEFKSHFRLVSIDNFCFFQIFNVKLFLY